ncbi:primosomal protein N' [Paraglaciecola sp. L1A13]|uniref:primosomal protein N' n=1 Tax=Paraglaciecola sp. L1A13 TaxID=2686359 RepID=UPI00131D9DF5|nr:primosomal protein N' [Paraglaciecola sp. L1A13]
MPIICVAVPVPKRQFFEYHHTSALEPGIRVRVPFGPRQLIGVVLDTTEHSQWQSNKIKAIIEVLDSESIFSPVQLKLCQWLSQYYQHPIGDVLHSAMPVSLRKGGSSQPKPVSYLRITEEGQQTSPESLGKARKQQQLLVQLQKGEIRYSSVMSEYASTTVKALVEKGFVSQLERVPSLDTNWLAHLSIGDKPTPNIEQAIAISQITGKIGQYASFLIEGVTGSGKTEVYLQAIESVLSKGQQVLILVPEIGLTPQTVQRFAERFNVPVGILHSNLTDNERLLVWQQSYAGQLPIIIGTRSAIFTPMRNPGMLIVDEEHDASYKQQDGLRYHARDLAVMRAVQENIPLVLGSATPALESLNNALNGKYEHLILNERAGNASHPKQQVLDIRNQPLEFGLAKGIIERIGQHLAQESQVMLFINRRGYAPALVCHTCGHVEECPGCNKPYTLHKQLYKLQCHHCGSAKAIPKRCQSCGGTELGAMGVGTEQLEQGLQQLFPQYKSVRIDSDSARGKNRLNDMLDKINRNEYQILIGTQILSKGHHFPNVTLVVILEVDGALFSADYRAAEHLAQLVTQLAGRAGRAEKPGEMWLQTHDPSHPLLQDLLNNGYSHFARYALLERQQAMLPPHTYQALFRAQSTDARLANQLLIDIATQFSYSKHVQCIGPLPALMEKRQGKFRMQLVLMSNNRGALQHALAHAMPNIEQLPLATKVRWALDVDPQDFM